MKRLLLLFFVFAAACSGRQEASPVLATVNGENFSLQEFKNYVDLERWKYGETALLPIQRILDAFLKDRLLLQEAKRRNVTVASPEMEQALAEFKKQYAKAEDFEKMISLRGWTMESFKKRREEEMLIKKLVDLTTDEALGLNEKELKEYYDAHPKEFWHPAQVRARQIVTDSKEKAQALREMLVKGGSFEEMALKYSLSPDRKQGGDLGFFERGVMPKEFDPICFYLDVGQLSPVVATPYGFHIFEVLARRPEGQLTFEEAKEKIRTKLTALKGREAFQKWYEALRAQAKIEVYEKVLKEVN